MGSAGLSTAGIRFSALKNITDPDGPHHPDHLQALQFVASHPTRDSLYSDLKAAIFHSLQRLNRLPRTDPFWHDTNRRPTLYKLPEFCHVILERNPNDTQALLTITALAVIEVGEFRAGRWSQLLTLNAISAERVVFAAILMEMTGAVDTHSLAEVSTSSGKEVEIVSHLKLAARDGGTLIALWANEILRKLSRPPQ